MKFEIFVTATETYVKETKGNVDDSRKEARQLHKYLHIKLYKSLHVKQQELSVSKSESPWRQKNGVEWVLVHSREPCTAG